MIVTTVAALGTAWWKTRTAEATKLTAKSQGQPPAPLRVSVITVTPKTFSEALTATGTLRAEEGVDLQVEVSGKIVSINFIEGSQVKKGDLLLKINDSELQASLTRAVHRKAIVELKEARLAALLRSGGVPQQDYDAVVNDLAVQKAEIELINAQIAKTEIRAPFDGVIGLRFVSEGAFITATSNAAARIATLQAVNNLKIDFSVPERYATRIKPGTPIRFTVDGSPTAYAGTIYAVEPRIDITTRTLMLRALCPNPDQVLLPGAFAAVECPLEVVNDALLVPAVAVVPGLAEKNLFVLQDGKAVRRPVELGTRTENEVRILHGLKPGERVITSGLQQLRHGMRVQEVSEAGLAKVPALAKEGQPSS